jgi:hypothetical protein
MANPLGETNPVISEAFTTLPSALYFPTVPGPQFATNKCPLPSKANERGEYRPVMNEEFTVAPEVVYRLTTQLPPPPSPTYRDPFPSAAILHGYHSPVIRRALIVAPEGVYAPTKPDQVRLVLFTTNICPLVVLAANPRTSKEMIWNCLSVFIKFVQGAAHLVAIVY